MCILIQTKSIDINLQNVVLIDNKDNNRMHYVEINYLIQAFMIAPLGNYYS